MITPGIGSMYKLFETESGKPTSTVSKNTPSQQFTRRSYVTPKPSRPGGLDPVKRPSTGRKEQLRPDQERIKKVVEKANNDKSVIENSNDYNVDSDSGSGSSNISEDIYKDFGGG